MTLGSSRKCTSSAGGWSLFAAFFALLLAGAVLAPPASAVSAPSAGTATGEAVPVPGVPDPYNPNNINVVVRKAPIIPATPNFATMDIVVTNKDKSPTTAHYATRLSFNVPGKAAIESQGECEEEHYNSPEVPIGIYRCTAIINGPGDWEFHGSILRPGKYSHDMAMSSMPALKVGSITLAFPNAQRLKMNTKALQYVVEGSTFDVFLLQIHVALAGIWLLLAIAMAFLAIPRLRRSLSAFALQTVEIRRGLLASCLWASFIGTLGTGIWLLSTQTAYRAPYSADNFSHAEWDKVTRLPYGQDYFLLMYGKILIFVVMAVASAVLVRESSRQAQRAQDAADAELVDELQPDGARGRATTGTAVRVQPRTAGAAVGASTRTLWICAVILLAGAASIGALVTGLEYLHELIESTVAATVVGGGG